VRVFLAILICKFSRFALRLLRRGGTTLPGELALKICPDLLRRLSKNISSIVITGTNGKTTTARIVEEAFAQSGKPYFANRSGANLIAGITAEYAINATLFGKAKRPNAVIECDEGALGKVCEYINPDFILVTNIFRDQMDRFGEISHTVQSIKKGLKNSSKALICINADDPLSVSLTEGLENSVIYYGLDVPLAQADGPEPPETMSCHHCQSPYEYVYRTYAHLGGWSCPDCGYIRPITFVSVTEILSLTGDAAVVSLRAGEESRTVAVNLPGAYNIYNATGAVCLLLASGFSMDEAVSAAENFNCGFGRMEKFSLGSAQARMILVKNAAGCNQVLSYLSTIEGGITLAICLNDRLSDGTDVSWIWEVYFELLTELDISSLFVSGIRAEEMALRLKYTSMDMTGVSILKDYDALINGLSEQNGTVIIIPTYSAMLELREKLAQRLGLGNFWE